jgi:hypothetical protein
MEIIEEGKYLHEEESIHKDLLFKKVYNEIDNSYKK